MKIFFSFTLQKCCLYWLLTAMTHPAITQSLDPKLLPPEYFVTYSSKALLSDLNFLVNTIEAVHPRIFNNCSEQAFKAKLQEVVNKVSKPLTRREFYLTVAPLISMLNDGHTGISVNDLPYYFFYEKNEGKLFPFDIEFNEDKVFIAQSYISTGDPLVGKELLSINSIPADQIKNDLLSLEYGERKEFKEELVKNYFRFYLFIVYQFSNQYVVKIKGKSSKEDKIYYLNGVSPQEIDEVKKKRNPQVDLKKNYSYQTLQTGALGLIDFRSCYDQGDFKTFLRETFAQIKKDSISDLIIDVRENIGGYNWLSQEILKYIANKPFYQIGEQIVKSNSFLKKELGREKYTNIYGKEAWESAPGKVISIAGQAIQPTSDPLKFDGRLYVLAGPKTFSSGMSFVATIKDNNLGVFIGEETGGVASSSGEMYSVSLPNTQLKFNLATKFYIRPGGSADGRGVLPDYEVQQNKLDLQRGVDTVLEFAKQLIRDRLTKK